MSEEPQTDPLPVVPDEGALELDPEYADLLGTGPQEHGLPLFARLTPERVERAFEYAAGLQLEAITRIVAQSDHPSFYNTDVRLELSAVPLRRLQGLIRLMVSAGATPEVNEMWQRLSPRLAAHDNAVYLNAALYDRLRRVPATRLNPEDAFAHARTLESFEQRGAGLGEEARARVAALRVDIADLEAEFGNAVQRQSESRALLAREPEALRGLSEDELAAARQTAERTGLEDAWKLPLVNTSQQPALESLNDPGTRRRLMELSLGRGIDGGADDTRRIISGLTAKRARLAGELGFGCFADLVTHTACAKTTEAVGELLSKVLGPTIEKAAKELRTLAAFGAEHELIEPVPTGEDGVPALHAADVSHLLTAYKRETFQLDPDEIAPYFELESVLVDGVFYAATRLYGISFREREDLVLPDPDVRAFDVQEADGSPLGLLLADFFARPTKTGGAWMDQLVDQARLTDTAPVITMTCNIGKPAPGAPAHLSLDQVTTLFHEFGHVLHGLFSDVTYPSRSGTNVPRDAVEYPSQLNEMWRFDPEVLANYTWDRARERGMPAELVARIEASEEFGQGIQTLEFIAAVLLDLSWHSLEPGEVVEHVEAFEQEVLHAAGIPAEVVPPRYRSGYFRHVFASDYAAGYYSYLWSEVLAADTAAWFREHGGLTEDNGEAYRSTVLAPGGSKDMVDSFVQLRGRPAFTRPLLIQRGLAEEPGSRAAAGVKEA